MKNVIKFIVALIAATFMAGVLIMHDASDNTVLSVYLFGMLGLCAILGVFDMPEKAKNENMTINKKEWEDAA